MELQIAINNLGMKIKVLILMIFAFHFLSFAQEGNNSKHYKLYKNGEKVPRPIVYILNNSTTNLQKLDNGDIIFNIDNQSFKYQSNTHKKDSLTISDFKKIELQYNIKTNKFKERNPKRKLKSILNNISCFNEYLYNNKNIVYIIIKISWIFVKDKNLYIGYNDNNNIKIIERTYEPEFKNALYNNYLIN